MKQTDEGTLGFEIKAVAPTAPADTPERREAPVGEQSNFMQ